MTIKRTLAILALAVGLSSCASVPAVSDNGPTATPTIASGYLYHDTTSATYLRILADSGGKFSGLWYGAIKQQDGTTSSYQGTISGTVTGLQVVISFTGVGADTDTGTLSADRSTLTLQYQGANGQLTTAVYHAASIADYNTAVSALSGP